MRRTVIGVAVAGAVAAVVVGSTAATAATAAGGTADEVKQEKAYTQAHLGDATVSESQATSAALARHPGTASDVHLQDEGDGLRWEVTSVDAGRSWEVQLDARSGAVVGDQPTE